MSECGSTVGTVLRGEKETVDNIVLPESAKLTHYLIIAELIHANTA